EVRDKDTGLVMAAVPLNPDLDYDIDYFQGRVMLARPISSTVDDNLLVRTGGLSGNKASLIVQYEYAPGFDEIDSLAAGGEGQLWINDYLKLGMTAYNNEEEGVDSGLYAASLTARKSTASWIKAQVGYSEGLVSNAYHSQDGGFEFHDSTGPLFEESDALAYRADLSIGFEDLVPRVHGLLTAYFQRLGAGYSAPGLAAHSDTDFYGGTLNMPLIADLNLTAKMDWFVEDVGLQTSAQEVDVSYQITDAWSVAAGVRNDEREDNSPVVAVTQEEGARTDLVVQTDFDSGGKWRIFGFGQATLRKTGDRESNRRGGVGGSYRVSDRLLMDGEVSYGDDGPGVRIGTDYQETAQTSRYLNYSLDNERAVDGRHARRGNLTTGSRTRLSDSASVYQEDRYEHSSSSNGLSRAIGVDWVSAERWNFGADWETGVLVDSRTLAETKRNAGGARFGYLTDRIRVSSGIEYRSDDTEQPDGSWSERTTWLFRNNASFQISEDWRLLAKLNHSFSDSSLGEFYDGGFTEAVLGYAYRPVQHDRLNVLAKYTYFYNLPATDQVNPQGTSLQVLQRSHIASLDVSYDLTKAWTLGGKYAFRRGEISLDRVNPEFFDNNAHLLIARADWRFMKNWEGSLEGRTLIMPDLHDQRSGALITLYRYLGPHFKLGVGYNFTDFSDDLTDLSYDRHGIFFNLIGTL
ncbi:MAG: flagellar motor protein MotB, partial [Deltaproteobacteria bacterium]|nr:flagellar motor protein MotB [Deltaproteobacteria bacterium]